MPAKPFIPFNTFSNVTYLRLRVGREGVGGRGRRGEEAGAGGQEGGKTRGGGEEREGWNAAESGAERKLQRGVCTLVRMRMHTHTHIRTHACMHERGHVHTNVHTRLYDFSHQSEASSLFSISFEWLCCDEMSLKSIVVPTRHCSTALRKHLYGGRARESTRGNCSTDRQTTRQTEASAEDTRPDTLD